MTRQAATKSNRPVIVAKESQQGWAAHDSEELLEIALADSFPASDPAASNICD